jgi:hypothetical protein
MVNIPKPFTISVPDATLEDLRERLRLTRFPPEISGLGRARGPPVEDMMRLVTRWKDGYDWRRREAVINKLPMFTCPIEVTGFGSLDIHFVHQKSKVEGAIPLLFVHGCQLGFLFHGHLR